MAPTSASLLMTTESSIHGDSASGTRKQENTGLNRVLGGNDDDLYGGTVIDFLEGNGGNDTLYRANGSTFESLDGGLAGDTWKEYAKESDQVWYVGGTNAADEIHVDFVTEPGVLADHHLITRLTNNNGNFSFAASVRLDFEATDAQGNLIWDAQDRVRTPVTCWRPATRPSPRKLRPTRPPTIAKPPWRTTRSGTCRWPRPTSSTACCRRKVTSR